MNRQEGGWRQWAEPVGSVSAFEAAYNAWVGSWSKDEYGEYCPVTCLRAPSTEISPSALGLGTDLTQPTDYLHGAEVVKASVTEAQHKVVTRDLVPVVVKGEYVQRSSITWTDGYKFEHPGEKS